jgi:hypothetical protein
LVTGLGSNCPVCSASFFGTEIHSAVQRGKSGRNRVKRGSVGCDRVLLNCPQTALQYDFMLSDSVFWPAQGPSPFFGTKSPANYSFEWACKRLRRLPNSLPGIFAKSQPEVSPNQVFGFRRRNLGERYIPTIQIQQTTLRVALLQGGVLAEQSHQAACCPDTGRRTNHQRRLLLEGAGLGKSRRLSVCR